MQGGPANIFQLKSLAIIIETAKNTIRQNRALCCLQQLKQTRVIILNSLRNPCLSTYVTCLQFTSMQKAQAKPQQAHLLTIDAEHKHMFETCKERRSYRLAMLSWPGSTSSTGESSFSAIEKEHEVGKTSLSSASLQPQHVHLFP